MPTLKPDQLDQAIRSKKIGSLYLFDGPENWLKQRAVNRIVNTLLKPEEKDLNLERFNGDDNSGGEVLTAIQSLPFLGEKRVVVVYSANEFKVAEAKVLAEGLSSIPKSTTVVLVYEAKANLRDALVASASSNGSLVTFWTPFPNQLPMWVVNESKNRGKTMAYDAARALGEACSDLQEISNELDKLILFAGKAPQIRLDDVLRHGLPNELGDYKSFEAALWSRDVTKALTQATNLSASGIRAESLFPVFERVFKKMLLAKHYLEEKGYGLVDVYSSLGMRGKTQQNQLAMGMKKYSEAELKESLGKIIQADFELKSGKLPNQMALTFLILNVMGAPKKTLAFR